DINRTYYELQERDLDNLETKNSLPATFSQSFLWNRNFQLRWDIFKALHFNFQSGTRAEIEEPYTQVNKDLYPDRYEAWKDSVRMSLRNFGRPLDYSQTTTVSYKVPLSKIPLLDWTTLDASFTSNYSWKRGAELEDGSTLGHTINTQRNLNLNGKLDLEKLYNHSKFLSEANKRFSASNARNAANKKRQEKEKADQQKKAQKEKEKEMRAQAEAEAQKKGVPVDSILAKQKAGTGARQSNANGVSQQKKKTKGFTQELTLYPDSAINVKHGQNSKRLRITALDKSGHNVKLKIKKVDENTIRILRSPKDTTEIRLGVVALPKREEQKGYSFLQSSARFLMMIRNVSVSYRNTYNLTLPGFMPSVGDMLGQRRAGGSFTPGLDFAFSTVGDSYIDKAKERGWLLVNDSVSTPAASSTTEDVQVKMTVEPFTDLKVDLSMNRTDNRNRTMQFMYEGCPTTRSGSFNMTTISLRTAFQSRGNAHNGYHSKTFSRLQSYLPIFQQRVESQYIGRTYPKGTGMTGTFNPENGTVDMYSPDVMIPAFLAAYTGKSASRQGLGIFPSITKMLPNWNVNYKGLSNLPWLRDNFKSITLTHSYKSIYSVGSYNSYSSWIERMGSGLGFMQNTTTGQYVPSSMFDVGTVSINETFSPLIGVNVTFLNNMTLKAEYKTTRVLSLSTTSAQVTETGSKDFVLGWGYKINDFRIASLFGARKASQKSSRSNSKSKSKTANAKDKDNTTASKGTANKFAHSLNLRFDFSLRNQDAIKRDLQTSLCEATSGNMAIKTSAQIDYAMSRMVTFSLYYDRQRSKPLLSSSSYPTVTQDFGMTMKFSLTR
ncbi:MAG: cell surface protein SprA, partial [Bacteroidaceae bacterium]